MNDRQIASFLSVAENSSFTVAASQLHLSQPAVSNQIASMENELDCILFCRDKHQKTRLTHAGKLYYEHYAGVRRQFEEISKAVERTKKDITGHLRAAFPVTWDMSGFLSLLLSDLKNSYPGLSISTDFLEPRRMRVEFLAQKLDIIAVMQDELGAFAKNKVNKHLIAKLQQLLMYSSLPTAIADRRPVLSDFKDADFAVIDDSSSDVFVKLVRQFCVRHGFTPKTVTAVSSSMELQACVKNLGYVAIVDEILGSIDSPSLQYVELGTYHDYYLIWKESDNIPILPIFAREVSRCIAASSL